MLLCGSIPARAGEPHPTRTPDPSAEVYPRACGGTTADERVAAVDKGLSPRVRGNRPARFCSPAYEGSIPARAGEPRPTNGLPQWTRVYPRACGGTRVRGGAGNGVIGSIPARAGEPVHPSATPGGKKVYPRACGGTRVRGGAGNGVIGSIPARAGEPVHPSATPGGKKVYPRACGGTYTGTQRNREEWGLSPRVRGNLDCQQQDDGQAGSIPARAGEPTIFSVSIPVSPVYPRACGGT